MGLMPEPGVSAIPFGVSGLFWLLGQPKPPAYRQAPGCAQGLHPGTPLSEKQVSATLHN